MSAPRSRHSFRKTESVTSSIGARSTGRLAKAASKENKRAGSYRMHRVRGKGHSLKVCLAGVGIMTLDAHTLRPSDSPAAEVAKSPVICAFLVSFWLTRRDAASVLR